MVQVAGTSLQLAGGLRLIPPGDPEFEDHVSSTYPQIAGHELYPRARNFMAVLSHGGTATAKAYRVLWVVQQSPYRQRTMQSVYLRMHCMQRENVRVVKPGEKRLVSPFFNYSTGDYDFHPDRVFNSQGMEVHELKAFPLLDSEVTSVSIDAVIYSGHTIAGSDKYNLRSWYLAIRAAEHDQGYRLFWKMEKMKEALGPGDSLDPAKIASILDGDVQYNSHFQGMDATAIYRHTRAQEAAIMKNILTSRGLAVFEANVAHRVKFPGEKLTAIE